MVHATGAFPAAIKYLKNGQENTSPQCAKTACTGPVACFSAEARATIKLNKSADRKRRRSRMSSIGSVSRYIERLKTGDQAAAGELCERYFDRLARQARRKLRGAKGLIADEEDVVVDVLDSLCRGAQGGRFPLLADRDDLWRLMMVLTERKAINQVKREKAKKRGGGKVRGESAFDGADGSASVPGIQRVADNVPCPATLGELKERFNIMLAELEDETLQKIAIWSMDGYTNQEIADRLGRSKSGVDRKLRLIRDKWAARH
jgi:DNA-directed RNA polymerase specialized sigma24 family protein